MYARMRAHSVFKGDSILGVTKAPSREEIVRLMSQLPSKVEALLKKCARLTPPYVPDYATFTSEATVLMKPFAEYSDAMFHAGSYSDVFRSAVRIFAKKKLECYHRMLKFSTESQEHKVEAMEAHMRFKLLYYLFGYTESYPYNMPKIFDLEYRFENEKDPSMREKILEDAHNLLKESSSGLYMEALLATYNGDLDRALELCEQAIVKFHGNTPAYKLKADILHAKAQKALEEGLQQEPRDKTLRLARDIEDHLWKLREKCANGLLDPEAAIEQLERLVEEKLKQEGIELRLYEEEVKKSLQSTEVMQPRTMKFLCTGEFLLTRLPKPLDYAPSAIEFCKAVENELYEHLFKPFKFWCLKNLHKVTRISDESRLLFAFIYKDKKFTLGNMTMVFQFLGSKKLLQENRLFQELKNFVDSFPRPEFLLGTGGMRSILTSETVNMYRNSAAHLSEFTLEKAQETKSWCYQLLNLLAKGISPQN